MGRKYSQGTYYRKQLSDSTKKTYLSQKLKKEISVTGNFGQVGTPIYQKRIKAYFNIGKIDYKKINEIKDEQKRLQILMKESKMNTKILSGEFLQEKIDTAKENIFIAIKNYLPDTMHIENGKLIIDKSPSRVSKRDNRIAENYEKLVNGINSLGDKNFPALASIWKKLEDFYPSMKENNFGMNKRALLKDYDGVLTQISETLKSYNII